MERCKKKTPELGSTDSKKKNAGILLDCGKARIHPERNKVLLLLRFLLQPTVNHKTYRVWPLARQGRSVAFSFCRPNLPDVVAFEHASTRLAVLRYSFPPSDFASNMTPLRVGCALSTRQARTPKE